MFQVYILRSEILQRFYVGSSLDLKNRLAEHNAGENKSTKSGIPWKVVHTEEFKTRADAAKKERQIKARGIGRYLEDIKKSG
jgi:putative endonuclease